jgi:sugar lactone lactonase YvrE
MKKIIFGFSLVLMTLDLAAQTPTVSLSLDKTSMSEAGGVATLTATLSAPATQAVTIVFKPTGTATYQVDYEDSFVGKGEAKTVAGGNGWGSAPNQFGFPSSVYVDNNGNIFVADNFNHRIQKWTPGATQGITVAGGNGAGSSPNQLSNPWGIYLDKNGNIFVADRDNHRIQKWTPGATQGTTVAGGNGGGSSANQLSSPLGVYIDFNGNIFIADTDNQRIQKWAQGTTQGTTVAAGNGAGSAENQLRSPYGVYVDSNGNIYIADTFNNRIQKWTPGATQGTTVAAGNAGEVYLDKSGTIFVADADNHRIQKWTPGATQGITVAGGNGGGSGVNQLNYPTGIYLDIYGNIFVADRHNHRIQKVQYQPQIIIPAGQTSGTASFSALNDLKFEDNEIIVLEIDNITNATVSPSQQVLNLIIIDDDTVPNVSLSLSSSTLFEDKTSIQLTVSLSNPSAKDVSANLSFSGTAILGTDYTVDKQTINFVPENSVETVTITAINDNLVEILESIQIEVSGGTNISTPFPNITAYLSSEDKPIINLSLDKTSMSEVGGVASLTATLSAPSSQDVAIALKRSGTATYQVDYDADFVGTGIEIKTVAGGNGSGSAANQFSYPQGVYVDSNGNIFVADLFNNRIQKWTPGATQGITVAGGNGAGSSPNQLSNPWGIYLDKNGNVFVSDRDNHRIQKWVPGATQGITVVGGNGEGSAANQLNNPYGVFVDSNGNIYIADTGNQRIQKWTPGASQGTTVAGGNGYGGAANQFAYPVGVFVDSNENIFVVDGNANRIQKWTPGATQGITVAYGASYANGGVYVDKDGTIFVADANNHRIQKWTPGATQGITVAGGNGGGSAANQLNYPSGVYLNNYGSIFIADRDNHRIQKLQNQTLIIPAGQTSGTASFSAINDLKFEDNETIVLEIDNITNAIVSPSQQALNLTIIDDDIAPNIALSLSNSTLFEDKTSIQLTVNLSNPSGKNVSANLNFSGTAILGTDYTVDKQIVNFVPGNSVETVTITAINDNQVEILESIQVQISSGTNISTPYPNITAYLSSEDKPDVSIATSTNSISEIKGQSILTATLSTATAKDVYIDLNLTGTATFDKDYQVKVSGKGTGQLLFEKGRNYGETTLTLPQKIAVDTENNLWVYDSGKLLKMNPRDKTVLKTIDVYATDFQITLDGIVHILNGSTIVRYDLDGNQKETIQINGLNGYISSFYFQKGNYYLSLDISIYKLNYQTKNVSLFTTASTVINWGIWEMVVNENEDIFLRDRNNIYKLKNNTTSQFIFIGANDPNYFQTDNPLLDLLPNGNVLVYREPQIYQTNRNLSLDEYDSNGIKIKNWMSYSQSPIQNEFSGLGSFAVIPGKTDLFFSYYVEPNKLGTDYEKYNRNQIYQFPYKPSIKIPLGQTTGVLTFEGSEDMENESDETILLSAENVSNANLLTNSISSIVIKDNQISLTKQLTSPIPSLESAALSWGDYDQDGDQDLAILGYNNTEGAVTRVYRNQSGTLVKTEQNLMQFLSGDIKWMDINKDGYLDLMVSGMAAIDDDNSAPKTLLYLSNAGQSFSLVANLTIEDLYSSKMALGDLDNDGDSDLAIMGRNINDQTVFQVYKKDDTQNTFTKITNFNPFIVGNDKDWDLKIADFDLDGDNDILYNGGYVRNNYIQSGNLAFSLNYTGLRYEVCKLFNDYSPLTILGIGTQNNSPIIGINQSVDFIDGTPTLKDGDIAVGDYNNDGLNDILLTGRNAVNTPQAAIYYQISDRKFAKVPNISIDGLYNSTADWVDYDVDGDLDLIMTGLDANSVQQTFFYKSNTGVKKNTAPSMPSNLRVIDKGNGFVEFKWDPSTDDYSSFFGYNIRLGTTPGGSELSNTMSNLQTGSRLLTVTPPLFINSYTTQLSPGRYYWSVQGIDQGYQGSTFATEQIFDLKYEWKLLNQIDIVDRSISPMSNPKFALLDIDNDNDLDLIYGSSTDRKVYLYQEKEYQLVSKNIGYGGIENIVSGDVNNDGKIDLIINGTDKQLVIYINTGGDFSEAYRLTNNGLLQTKLKIIDVNNNGLKEIMFAGMTSDLSSGVPKLYSLEWSGLGITFNFLDESSKIATLKNAAYDFGDFDKDSKLDFILSGSGNLGTRTILYKNTTLPGDPMTVSATVDVLPKITKGTIDFMDFDADGDEDLIFTGTTIAGELFQVYDNQLANNISSFVARGTNLDAIQESNLNFGDFNGDGYTDIFYSGKKTGTGKITRLAQYNSLTKNYENSTFDYGNLTDAEVAFGDIDADGDLDMVLGGNDALNENNKILRILLNVRNESAAVGTTQAIKESNILADRNVAPNNILSTFGANNVLKANKAPNPPNLKSVKIVTENTKKLLSFSWNAATDDNTPSTGLTYSLRIGTAADTDNLLSTNADKSGVLKVPNVGNVVGNLGWKIKMLPDGVYYWSVQSVDASFVGSAFSTSQKFAIQNGDLLTVPTQPEAFTNGNNKPCKATSEVYTVPAVNEVTTYRWTYSGEGATITGTGNSVNVAFSATFTAGTLSVEAMNAYGASPKRSIDIIIGTTPAQPGAFTIQALWYVRALAKHIALRVWPMQAVIYGATVALEQASVAVRQA